MGAAAQGILSSVYFGLAHMNTKSTLNNGQENRTAFDRAIVIGSSITGLTVARVLTDHFAQVTIIERDRLSNIPDFRRGVPQARHAHTLPLRGQAILEQQFPGLIDELLAQGAISINGDTEIAFFIAGGWHQLRHRAAAVSMSCSRPLLETTIYRRLAGHLRIQIIEAHEVTGLTVDQACTQVTGVRIRNHHAHNLPETKLAADLVVDASGRDSQAPRWLASLGYPPILQTVINSFAGYASRIYQRPAHFSQNWKTLFIRPSPPHGTRGGAIIPIEGDRWHVTLMGIDRDYPPTNEAGFLDFAHSLPAPQFFEAITAVQPLTKVYGFRRTENRVRHYDKLPRYLEGFLVGGDAAYALNPVYAQGMSAAVMGSQALDHCLREQRRHHNLAGLAKAFQNHLVQAVADPWRLATYADQRWPGTEVTEGPVPIQNLRDVFKFDPVLTNYSVAYQ